MLGAFPQKLVQSGQTAGVIISVALMLFLGFAMTRITKALRLPDVTAYILTGILIGPYCLNLIPASVISGMDFISDIALAFIAFSVGEFFKLSTLKKSGFGVDYAAQSEEEIARIIKTKLELEMPGGVLIGNPIPDEYAMDFDYMEGIITKALELADAQHIHGKEITPFLLAHIKELTGGESFASNVQLALNNARCAARIAVSLAKM